MNVTSVTAQQNSKKICWRSVRSAAT